MAVAPDSFSRKARNWRGMFPSHRVTPATVIYNSNEIIDEIAYRAATDRRWRGGEIGLRNQQIRTEGSELGQHPVTGTGPFSLKSDQPRFEKEPRGKPAIGYFDGLAGRIAWARLNQPFCLWRPWPWLAS